MNPIFLSDSDPKEGDVVWLLSPNIANKSLVHRAVTREVQNCFVIYGFDDPIAIAGTSGAPIINDQGLVVAVHRGGAVHEGKTYGAGSLVSRFLTSLEKEHQSFSLSTAAVPRTPATSVNRLKGGRLEIPSDAVPLEHSVALCVGTPLLLEDIGGQWSDVFYLSGNQYWIQIRYKVREKEITWPRGGFVIRKEVLAMLDDEDSKSEFAKNVSTEPQHSSISPDNETVDDNPLSTSIPPRKTRSHRPSKKSYPIDIEIPQGWEIIPKEVDIPLNTRLSACWARKWYRVVSIEESDELTVPIKWDDFPSDAWDCSLSRNELIIETSLLKEIIGTHQKSSETD